jgi:AAHS family cis,cis-muconate transporter-like MFS transporter
MAMTDSTVPKEKISRMGWIVAITIIVAMAVEGVDLQFMAMALPSLIKEFGLTNVEAGFLATVTLGGQMVGGIYSGWLADRIGRAKVVAWGIAWFSVMTAALAFTHSFVEFAVIRFLGGIGLSAVYCVGIVFVSEYIPTSRRSLILGLVSAGSPVGYALASIAASYVIPVYGWRPLFWITVIPAFSTIFLLRTLKDPESWKYSQQLKKASPASEGVWTLIAKDKKVLKMIMLWSLCAIGAQAGYYAANNWMPTYLQNGLGISMKNIGWFVAGNYIMMIFGKILAGACSDRYGRKATWVGSSILTAIAFPMLAYFVTKDNVGFLLLFLGLFYGCPQAVLATYLSESFPTNVRATSVALAYNIGRIGGMVSPMVLGYIATHYSFSAGLAFLGVSYVVIALIALLFIKEKMYDPKDKDDTPAAAPETTKQASIPVSTT